MSFERRDVHGAAVATVLSTDIDGSATSFTISDSTGWPDGTNGKFLIAIARGTSSEEKVLVQSRSGTTLTLASSGDRGADDSSAQAHSAGDAVEHVTGRVDADEANYAVQQTVGTVTTKGDLLVATSANTFGRQAVGSNNTVIIADNAQTNGVRYGQVTANEIAASVAGSGLGGANGSALTVNVDNSTIEINSDSLRIKDAGIVDAKIADGTITAAKLAGSIPTTAVTFPAWTSGTVTWTAAGGGASLGAGTVTGKYQVLGKTYMFRIVFTSGAGTNGGTGIWRFTLPSAVTTIAEDQTVAACAIDSGSNRYPASAHIAASSSSIGAVAVGGGTAGAMVNVPFSWIAGSKLLIGGTIEIT